MNAPAPIVDASDLLAVVERARALLDEGDVLAARMLAAGAYDQAKADELLGVDGDDEFTIYMAPVGKPRPERTT